MALTLVASGVPPGLAARMHCFQTRWGAPFPDATCVGKCKTRGDALQPLPRCARLRASLPWPRYARLRASLRCAVDVYPYNLASLCSPQSLTTLLGWGARKGLTSRASAAAGLESYRKNGFPIYQTFSGHLFWQVPTQLLNNCETICFGTSQFVFSLFWGNCFFSPLYRLALF